MTPRILPCVIEACADCLYWEFSIHGCSHPDWPRIDPFIRDPGSIPDCCPLEVAPDGTDTASD